MESVLGKAEGEVTDGATSRPPKFENALISCLDQRRFEEIRASMADDPEDDGEEEQSKGGLRGRLNRRAGKAQEVGATKIEESNLLMGDVLDGLQGLKIATKATVATKAPSNFSGLLKDLKLDFEMPAFRHTVAPPRKTLQPDLLRPLADKALENSTKGASVDPDAIMPNKFPTSTVLPGFQFRPRNALGPEEQLIEVLNAMASTSKNVFFEPALTFEQMAQHIHSIFAAAETALRDHFISLPQEKLVHLLTCVKEPNNPIPRLCLDFHHIAQFLEMGREGWDIVLLPDNFFLDVEPLLERVIKHTETLCTREGCGHLRRFMADPLGVVQKKLESKRRERYMLWEQSKARFEREARMEARKKVGDVEDAVWARRALGIDEKEARLSSEVVHGREMAKCRAKRRIGT